MNRATPKGGPYVYETTRRICADADPPQLWVFLASAAAFMRASSSALLSCVP